MRAVLCLAAILALSASLRAQVVYEPVQFQYQAGAITYYYGGSDPFIHRHARLYGDVRLHPATGRVYTDALGLRDARIVGYTANDARNDAYANASRYFSKRQALRAAIPQADGTWLVPAQPHPAGTIEIRPYVAPPKASTKPAPVLVIPRDLLDKKLNPPPADPKV